MHLGFFLENEQQIIGKGNEGESQNPHQTLVTINIAKPMFCHSLQCYHCLFLSLWIQPNRLWPNVPARILGYNIKYDQYEFCACLILFVFLYVVEHYLLWVVRKLRLEVRIVGCQGLAQVGGVIPGFPGMAQTVKTGRPNK